jgi:hypothetical protein
MSISESGSDEPASGIRTSLQYDYHAAEPLSQRYPYWLNWDTGTTDGNGRVAVGIKYTSLDRSIGNTPPKSRDWVTGRPYVIEVGEGERKDVFHMALRPTELFHGKFFNLSVIAIGEPKYVKTDK